MEFTGKRNKARNFLKGGLIVTIIMHIVYGIASGIYLIVLLVVGLFTAVVAAIIGAATGSGGDVSTVDIAPGYIVFLFILLALVILSFVGIILSAIALGFIRNATTSKKLKVAGILAIIASIPTIIIPLELLGGINALGSKVEEAINEGEVVPEVEPQKEEVKAEDIIDADVEPVKEEATEVADK